MLTILKISCLIIIFLNHHADCANVTMDAVLNENKYSLLIGIHYINIFWKNQIEHCHLAILIFLIQF